MKQWVKRYFKTSIIMFFPLNYPVTAKNMNYGVVLVAGFLLIAAAYWIISARHWFVGPKRIDTDSTPLLSIDAATKDTKEVLAKLNLVDP